MAKVKPYQITYEYKPRGKPWRTMRRWQWGVSVQDAVKRFKAGEPSAHPEKYRKIKGSRF